MVEELINQDLFQTEQPLMTIEEDPDQKQTKKKEKKEFSFTIQKVNKVPETKSKTTFAELYKYHVSFMNSII